MPIHDRRFERMSLPFSFKFFHQQAIFEQITNRRAKLCLLPLFGLAAETKSALDLPFPSKKAQSLCLRRSANGTCCCTVACATASPEVVKTNERQAISLDPRLFASLFILILILTVVSHSPTKAPSGAKIKSSHNGENARQPPSSIDPITNSV